MKLRPERWQFPPGAGPYDDQWLVISGTVDLGDRTWSFTDPCLLIGEARELASWLRQAATGEGEPSLEFIEPNLGFSTTARDGDEFTVRIHLAAEAAPSWPRDDDHYSVELRLRADQVLAAADTWTGELDALPSRSFASTD